MNKGKIKIRQKENGEISRLIQIPGGTKLGIPQRFEITDEMNGLECEYESTAAGIIRIVVNGKEVAINTQLQAEKEAKERRKAEEEAEKKRQADEARKAQQQKFAGNQVVYASSAVAQAFSTDNTKLPEDTKRALNGFSDRIDNFALRLHKLANFWDENKGKPTLYQLKKGRKVDGVRTPDLLMRHTLPDKPHPNYGNTDFAALCSRQTGTAEALFQDEKDRAILPLRVSGRLVMGIGSASVFETGFLLHHVYGIPYIPASSIKGVVRSWIITEVFDGHEGNALADRTFCDLFGCPAEWQKDKHSPKYKSWYEINKQKKEDFGDRMGNIVFMDAYPTAPPKVVEDVMNVHYKEYYEGKSAPVDYLSTNPISFLTVEGGEFQFLLGFKPLQGKEGATATGPIAAWLGKSDNERSLLQAAEQALTRTLTEHGIGAKTAVGYGYFEA